MPVLKDKEQEKRQKEEIHNRMMLVSAARTGDPAAIESLTMDDIDTYSKVSQRLVSEDVFSEKEKGKNENKMKSKREKMKIR